MLRSGESQLSARCCTHLCLLSTFSSSSYRLGHPHTGRTDTALTLKTGGVAVVVVETVRVVVVEVVVVLVVGGEAAEEGEGQNGVSCTQRVARKFLCFCT